MEYTREAFEQTYLIIDKIGQGGGGTALKAYHKRLKKEVVLKRIHSDLKNINTRAETDILKGLKHAYLPQVLDFLEFDGEVYTVMDYIEGESLKDFLAAGKNASNEEILRWFKQLCQALHVLHSQKSPIIHGDIKPANIMLTPDGNICLIDFNIASVFEGNQTQVAGYTQRFAAPEQIAYYEGIRRKHSAEQVDDDATVIEDATLFDDATIYEEATLYEEATAQKQPLYVAADAGKEGVAEQADADTRKTSTVDIRADIYSLGATMYYLLSGKTERDDNGQFVDIRSLCPKISEPMAYIVMKCVEVNPENRYQSAQELCNALNNIFMSSDRYKKLLFQQRLIRIGLIVGIFFFGGLAFAGAVRISQERDTAYLSAVIEAQECSARNDMQGLEKAYLSAVDLFPAREEAYLIKSDYLHKNGAYAENIAFLLDIAIPYVTDEEGLANLYMLLGNSYFELQQYEMTEQALETAVSYGSGDSSVYRDLIIAQVRSGKSDKAQETLQMAALKGLSDDGICYINGEMEFAKMQFEEAFEEFAKAAGQTKDSYMKMRSYVMMVQCIKKLDENVENIDRRIDTLKKAKADLKSEYSNVFLEELAQAYIGRFALSGLKEDALGAVDALNELIELGYGHFDSYLSVVNLYQKCKLYEEERNVLNQMLQKYGEDYRVYKYFSYMELLIQQEKENNDRDYSLFAEYYETATDLYQNSKKDNQADPEMNVLNQLYEDVLEGGWLEEGL